MSEIQEDEMTDTPETTGITEEPIDALNLAVQQFHAALDVAQTSGWKVTVHTVGDNAASTAIRVNVTRRLERK